MHLDCVFAVISDSVCIMLEEMMGADSPTRRLVDEFTRGKGEGRGVLCCWEWSHVCWEWSFVLGGVLVRVAERVCVSGWCGQGGTANACEWLGGNVDLCVSLVC